MAYQPVGDRTAADVNLENTLRYRTKRERDRLAGRLPVGGVITLSPSWDAFYGGLDRAQEDAAEQGMGYRTDFGSLARGLSDYQPEGGGRLTATDRAGIAGNVALGNYTNRENARKFGEEAYRSERLGQIADEMKASDIQRQEAEAFADPNATRESVLAKLPPQLRPVYAQQWAKQDAEAAKAQAGLTQAQAALAKSEQDTSPLVPVIGPDGRSILVPRSQAVGMRPASSREQGRPVTSGDASDLADFDTSKDELAAVRAAISPEDSTGIVAQIGAKIPYVTQITGWGTDAKKRQAVIDRVKQVIGKTLEGGVLRKEDEAKYEKILPTIGDAPAVAAEKLNGLEAAIDKRKNRRLDSLADAGYEVSHYREREAGAGGGGTVKLKAPNGAIREVPADQAEHYISKGAVRGAMMPDWFSENAPTARRTAPPDSDGADWFELYRPDRKPASAEDFAPAPRDVSIGNVLGQFAKAIPSALIGAVKTAYEDQRPEDVALGPARVLAPLIRQAGMAHAAEARKSVAAPTVSEAVGHGAAALLPVVGPVAAQAGEDIGSGDPERQERGLGQGAALVTSTVAPVVAAKVGPKIAPPLASIGEQLASKGKTVAASPVLREAVKTAILEGGAHAAGVPPGVLSAIRVGVKLKNVLDRAKGIAADEAAAATAEAPAAPVRVPGSDLARDAAGKPVKAPSIAEMLSDSLEALKGGPPPARVTTPPEPSLPAGYTPRTTAPKPKAASAKTATEATPTRKTASLGEKNYFLKKSAANSPVDAAVPSPAAGPIDVADLPASWRGRTGPTPTKTPITVQDAADVAAELEARGMSTSEALMHVINDRSLSAVEREYLTNALKKAARRKAG